MTHIKANKSKVLTLILGLATCLALMLGIAFASPTSTVYAEGETLTPYDSIIVNGSNTGLNSGRYLDEEYTEQVGNPTSGYVAKYNNGVLTLNNYRGKQVGRSAIGSGYYIIELIGDNVITDSRSCVLMDSSSGGQVIIRGNGTLTLNTNNVAGEDCYAIDGGSSSGYDKGEVVIEGNAKVTINATTNGANEFAVGIIARNLTIQDNASIDITVKNTNNDTANRRAQGVLVRNMLTINTNGKIEIDATVAGGTDAYSCGINASNATYTKIKDMTIKWKKSGSYGWPISGSDEVDSTTHAINKDDKNCYASYRYGTPRYVVAANGKLVGPGVPESSDRDYGYFLEGDKIILNAPSLQVSETDTTNIPFDKWFSFANDAVITNATSQTGAILTVPNKDVTVWANYKAFTEQPYFERVSDTKGTVEITLFGGNYSSKKIRPLNDLTANLYSRFMQGDGTTYKAEITSGNIPNGQYVVELQHNYRALFYSEPFTVDYISKAAIDDVDIFAGKGLPLKDTDITVTLTGYTFETALSGDWITNLPNGLVQTLTRISDTEAKITLSGTPTDISDGNVNITIPKGNITGLARGLKAEKNSNANFNIKDRISIEIPTAIPGLIYNGNSQKGVNGYDCLIENNWGTNAGNYIATARLFSESYIWKDGTFGDKEIPWSIEKKTPEGSDFNRTSPYFFTYDGNEKEVIVEAREGYDSDVIITISLTCDGVPVAKAINAGEYIVSISTTETANFKAASGITSEFWSQVTIGRARQEAPDISLFTIGHPSSATAKDGKITGVTVDMEYQKEDDSAWTSGTGSDITGLSVGNYVIRYKRQPNYIESPTIRLTLRETAVTEYNLTVNNGYGGGKYAEGIRVKISPFPTATGKRFTGWTIEGISGIDTTKEEIIFNMPANDVTATPNYEDIEYTVTVNGGTTNKAKAKFKELVTITANELDGQEFVRWEITGIEVSLNLTKKELTFNMPNGDVTATATYRGARYSITVNNGSANYSEATYQTEVTVTANAPDTDMYFDKWEVTGITLSDEDLAKSTLTFQMPAGNVTFKATYRAIEKFEIVVVDGTKDKEVAKAGETVAITANPAPAGKVFDKWTCETAGVTIEFANATNSKTTFVMPASNIKIQAHFRAVDDKPSVEIKVEGGTGAGTYKEGETITITANDPAEGKVFKGWQDASGKIVSSNKSYTFTVSGETTLTAVYEDAPVAKKGLSGGQIAGIVIGSVAGVGIVGFAIFWFVVKKKSFADLISAIKETVNKVLKKGNKEE